MNELDCFDSVRVPSALLMMSLIDLARELNLLDIVETEAPPNEVPPQKANKKKKTRKHKKKPSSSPDSSSDDYRYMVCLDFEATCWEKADQAKWRVQEIIEFPAVLLNCESGQVESEFQEYLKPVEFETLSDFCIRLTGILQQTVDRGISINECLARFDVWIRAIVAEKGVEFPKTTEESYHGNIAIATWTDWDGVTLAKECARKKIKRPSYFGQWIDVRALFIKRYQHKPRSFRDALSYVGLKFVGRPHSGIDDARNLARLVQKMRADRTRFYVTKDCYPFQKVNN